MAEIRLTILGEDKSSQAFKSVRSEINGLESSMRGLISVTGLLTTTFAGLSIAGVFKKGIEAVDNFQQSVVQTAAMITSLQGGDNVAENYRKAKEYADGLQYTLQQVDAKTTLNLASLQAMTEEMVKQGVVLDNTSDTQVEAFTRIANAVAVYSRNGASEIQLRQEIRALMMGQVDQNSQLASMLQRTVDGPLKQQVEKWKQSGTLIEELGKRLSGFGMAAEDLNQTWSAVKSSLQTSIDLVLRAGFTGIVKEISEWLNKINEYLKSHREEVAGKIKSAWETTKAVLSGVAEVAKTILNNFEPFAAIIVGGAIIKGVTGIVGTFTALHQTLLAVRAAMIAIGAISGSTAAATAAAAGGVGAAGGAAAGIGGLMARGGIIAAGGLGLGYALQPAVRWADKKLYENTGWSLTHEAMYNEAEQRNAEADARWKFFTTENARYKGAKAGGAVPSVTLGDTPEQIAEKIKLQEKELAAYKVNQDSMTAIAKARAEIELGVMKGRYEQGLVSTRSYFEEEKKIAITTAQEKFNNAATFLKEEEKLLDFIKAKKGEQSPEYQQELANNKKALESMQLAQLDYAKTTIESERKITEELRKREEEYVKLTAAALDSACNFDVAEAMKQEVYRKSNEYLKLEADALDGNAKAWEAMLALEKKEASDLVTAQNKKNEAFRNTAEEVAKQKDAMDALLGKDKDIIEFEAKVRESLKTEAELRDKLTLAWTTGNAAEIQALQAKIQYQETYNQTLAREKELQQQKQQAAVLSGQISGFNNGVAILSNPLEAGTNLASIGYINGQPIYPYQSPGGNSATFQSVTSDPWYNNRYSTGMGNTPEPRASGGPVKPYATYQINENGTEYLTMGNKGGYITAAGKGPLGAADTNVTFGDINLSLPNVTNQSNAEDLVRMLFPKIKLMLDTRFRS